MELSKEQELLQAVIAKAWEDESFKQELISAPVAAIEKLTGGKLQLPEGKTLVVRDQTDEQTIYINIPTERSLDDLELSEEQLEAVAGGEALPAIWAVPPPSLRFEILPIQPGLPIERPVTK